MLTRITNTSFRPRPLDINKAIPIIRKELDEEELDDTLRSVPVMPTGMEKEEEAEKHLQEIINNVNKSAAQTEIPTPVVKVVEGYDEDNSRPFNRPQTYIRYKDKTEDEWDQLVEYDMDDEDEEFLNQLNGQKKVLSDTKFELLLDRFEKECSKNNDSIPPFNVIETIQGLNVRPNILQAAYLYWSKRRSKMAHTTIIRLLKPPDPEDPSPYKAFRPRTEEKKRKARKNDQPSLARLKQVRHEMERARTLLEMIKKREKLKQDHLQIVALIYEAQILDAQQNPDKYLQYDEPEPLEELAPLPTPTKERKRRRLANAGPRVQAKPEPTDIYEFLSESELQDESDEDSDVDSPTASPSKRDIPTAFGLSSYRIIEDPSLSTVGTISLPRVPSFRGRARVGRGGRIVFDRKPLAKTNGILDFLETDEECNSRIDSLVSLYQDPCDPLAAGPIDPERLLKKLERLMEHKKKHDLKQATLVSSEAN